MEDDTRTLREALSTTGSQAGISVRSHRTSTIGDTEFDFDPSLLQSELYRRATTKPAQREEPKPTPRIVRPDIFTATSPERRDRGNEEEKPADASQIPAGSQALSNTLSRNYSTISVTSAKGARPSPGKDRLGPDPSEIPRSRSVSSTYSRTSAGSEPKVRRWLSSSSSSPSLATSQSSKSSEVQKKKFGFLSRLNTLSSANLRASAPKIQPLSPTPAYRHRGMRSQEIDINRSINFASADGLDAPALVRAAQAGSRIEVERLIDNGDDIESCHEHTGRTALAVAAHCGNAEVVETLIQLNANLQTRDATSSTSLHLAASRGHTRVLELLLKEHVPLEDVDDQKRTALWLAAERGHLDAVGLLLQYKAKVDARSNNQLTALHVAVQRGDAEMTELLIRSGAHIEGRDRCFMTPLHYACEVGHENVVVTLLNERATIEAMGADEKSPLICAAAEGRNHIVDLLLRRKASIRSTDNRGNNALHWAASKGHVSVAEILLQKKLSINDKTTDGLTALHLAVIGSQFDAVEYLLRKNAMLESRCRLGRTPLHYACGSENPDIVRLLLSAGADAQAVVEGELLRPIHIAASKGVGDVVQLLCEKSVLLDPHDSAGDRPLCMACSNGHADVVEMLLDFGAQLRLPFGDRSYEDSPLCLAAKGGHTAVVSILLKRGASVRQKDEVGWPPIRYAAHYGHPEVLELLLLAANVAGDVPGGPTGLGYDYGGFAASASISDEDKQRVKELLSQAENQASNYMAERPSQPFTAESSSLPEAVELGNTARYSSPPKASGLSAGLTGTASSREIELNPQMSRSSSLSTTDPTRRPGHEPVSTTQASSEPDYAPPTTISSHYGAPFSQPAHTTDPSPYVPTPDLQGLSAREHPSYGSQHNTPSPSGIEHSTYTPPPASVFPPADANSSYSNDYVSYNNLPQYLGPPTQFVPPSNSGTQYGQVPRDHALHTPPSGPPRSPSSHYNLPIRPVSLQYPPTQYPMVQYPPVHYPQPQYPPAQYQPAPQQPSQYRSRAEIAQLIESRRNEIAQLQMMLPSIDEGPGHAHTYNLSVAAPGGAAHQQQAWGEGSGGYNYGGANYGYVPQISPQQNVTQEQDMHGRGNGAPQQQSWAPQQNPHQVRGDGHGPQEMP